MTSSAICRHLCVDLETFSSADLPSVGVYKYAAAPDFQVLLFGYSWDGEPVCVIDLTREELPVDLIEALLDDTVIKHAFNAAFERVCLSRYLWDRGHLPKGTFLGPASWRCTMVQASYFGAAGSLKQVAAFLGVDARKDAAGTRLINKFSKPSAKPVPRAGADWERFIEYCGHDVESEMAVATKIGRVMPDREQLLYVIDQEINDRGIGVDTELARAARLMSETALKTTAEKLQTLTELDNPNSVAQLKGWLRDRGCAVDSIGKEVLEAEYARADIDPLAKRVIALRLAGAKSSTKKYVVAEDAAGDDQRLRGSFQFYGAATGRWSGRLMQLQNLPRGDLSGAALDDARALVKCGEVDMISWLYDNVQDTLKSLIRTVLIPKEGSTFAVSDFSAIEARVLAWLAGETWALEIFKTTGKVYEGTASRMFGVPIERIDKDLRARGKVATLALGYQGGPAALERMGALSMGIPQKELPKIVRMWRNANKRIVGLWGEVEAAAVSALSGEGTQAVAHGLVRISRDPGVSGLEITLPSSRALYYRNAKLDPYTGKLSYEATGKGASALKVDTYGGRLTENITQAIARDILAAAIGRLHSKEFAIVAHVHDEVVVEVPSESAEDDLALINDLMATVPKWASGLPLGAEGYTCASYRKG